MQIKLKRVYEAPSNTDGTRILVDRVWPRGLSKEQLQIAYWAKEIAPSTELRRWYAHAPEKWPEFKNRYFAELKANPAGVHELLRYALKEPTTFVFSSKELRYNNAVALREFLSHPE